VLFWFLFCVGHLKGVLIGSAEANSLDFLVGHLNGVLIGGVTEDRSGVVVGCHLNGRLIGSEDVCVGVVVYVFFAAMCNVVESSKIATAASSVFVYFLIGFSFLVCSAMLGKQ